MIELLGRIERLATSGGGQQQITGQVQINTKQCTSIC